MLVLIMFLAMAECSRVPVRTPVRVPVVKAVIGRGFEAPPLGDKITFEEYREKVTEVLIYYMEGLYLIGQTDKVNFPYKVEPSNVPNNNLEMIENLLKSVRAERVKILANLIDVSSRCKTQQSQFVAGYNDIDDRIRDIVIILLQFNYVLLVEHSKTLLPEDNVQKNFQRVKNTIRKMIESHLIFLVDVSRRLEGSVVDVKIAMMDEIKTFAQQTLPKDVLHSSKEIDEWIKESSYKLKSVELLGCDNLLMIRFELSLLESLGYTIGRALQDLDRILRKQIETELARVTAANSNDWPILKQTGEVRYGSTRNWRDTANDYITLEKLCVYITKLCELGDKVLLKCKRVSVNVCTTRESTFQLFYHPPGTNGGIDKCGMSLENSSLEPRKAGSIGIHKPGPVEKRNIRRVSTANDGFVLVGR